MLGQQNHAAGGANKFIIVRMLVYLCFTSQKPSERKLLFPQERTTARSAYVKFCTRSTTCSKIQIFSNVDKSKITYMSCFPAG